MPTLKPIFCSESNKQNICYIAGALSFVAQCALTMVIDDQDFFFFIITFSLCYHVLLWYGTKKHRIIFMLPYLIGQIICSAYLTAECFQLIAVCTSSNWVVTGCFLKTPLNSTNPSCDKYDFFNWETFNMSAKVSKNHTCHECFSKYKSEAQLAIACLILVIGVMILTWNIALRFILHIRSNNLRNQHYPRVAYLNHTISMADLDASLSRPSNAPPMYTEKASTLNASTLTPAPEFDSTVIFVPPVCSPTRESIPSYDAAVAAQQDQAPPFSPSPFPLRTPNSPDVTSTPTTETPDLVNLEKTPEQLDSPQMTNVELSNTDQDVGTLPINNHSSNPLR